tara:strand:- start:842 stop:1042 length:201 start_codon:yes stop_codon:yes gene_type:complete
MIKRQYFMSAKCSESNGYAFQSTMGSYRSIFAQPVFVFDDMSRKFKQKLLKVRPNGQFEVLAFNRV